MTRDARLKKAFKKILDEKKKTATIPANIWQATEKVVECILQIKCKMGGGGGVKLGSCRSSCHNRRCTCCGNRQHEWKVYTIIITVSIFITLRIK